MSDRESLYAAICAAPRDELPKLVFADWLDEHGDAADRARAELIRIQCEWETDARGNERSLEPYRIDKDDELRLDAGRLAKADPTAGRALALLQQAGELEFVTRAYPPLPLPEIPGTSYRYPGRIHGLQSELRISRSRAWEERLPELAKVIPIRELVLDPFDGQGYEAWSPSVFETVLANVETLYSTANSVAGLLLVILAAPPLAHLKRFSTHHNPFETDLFWVLERADHLRELEELDLRRFDYAGATGIDGRFSGAAYSGLRRLKIASETIRYPSVHLLLPFAHGARRLEELEVSGCTEFDESAEFLTRESPGFDRMIRLAFASGDLTARGAGDLLTSDALPALRQLNIGGNVLGDLVGKRLQMAKDYPKLESFVAGHGHLTPDGIVALAHWPGFAGLRKLGLSGNGFNHSAMSALTSASAPHLRTLGLAHCELHGSHIRELVTAPFVRSLWTLDLRDNPFDDAAARALASSPFLDGLQCLHLGLPDDDPNLPRLRERFGDRLV